MLLLIYQLARELERGPNVLARQTVLSLYVFEAHSASKTANYQGDGHSCAPNDGFPVADARVNYDSVIHMQSLCCGPLNVKTSGARQIP
jgi:hypothetical protein